MSIQISKIKELFIYSLIAGTILFFSAILYFYLVNSLPRIDNPSSTDAIKYIFQFGAAVVIGFAGAIIGPIFGRLVEKVIKKIGIKFNNIKISRIILALFLLFLSIVIGTKNFYQARDAQNEWNKKNTPGVKIDKQVIEKIEKDPFKESNNEMVIKNYDLSLNDNHAIGYISYNELGKEKTFIWNGEKKSILFGFNDVYVKNDNGSILFKLDLSGYNYIDGVSYVVYPENSDKSYLFILSRLRATSKQSILQVFSISGDLVYEELMNENDIIEIGENESSEKIVIIGNTDQKLDESSNQWKPYKYIRNFYYKIKK